MAREAQSTTIGGHTYEVRMLGATASYKLLLEIGKVIGPSFGHVVDSAGNVEQVLDTDVSGAFLSKAIEALVENLDEARFDRIVGKLKEVTNVDGKPLAPIFEEHFRGSMGQMFQWIAFAVKSQYEDFFGALSSVAAQGKEKLAAIA